MEEQGPLQASLTHFPLLATPCLAFPQAARVYPRPYLQAKNRRVASKGHLVSKVQPVYREQPTSQQAAKARQEASTLKARPSLLR